MCGKVGCKNSQISFGLGLSLLNWLHLCFLCMGRRTTKLSYVLFKILQSWQGLRYRFRGVLGKYGFRVDTDKHVFIDGGN